MDRYTGGTTDLQGAMQPLRARRLPELDQTCRDVL